MPLAINPKFISPDMTDDQELADGLAAKQDLIDKNQPNGYVGLDSSGIIDPAVLPPTVQLNSIVNAIIFG